MITVSPPSSPPCHILQSLHLHPLLFLSVHFVNSYTSNADNLTDSDGFHGSVSQLRKSYSPASHHFHKADAELFTAAFVWPWH